MKTWMILVAMLVATGCSTPQTTYDWGSRDKDQLALMKDPAKLEAYGLSLRKLIESHPDGRRLPPGICAEYGYVLLVAGEPGQAQPYFELEKKYWPESSHLMDRMIANCRPKSSSAPAEPSTLQKEML